MNRLFFVLIRECFAFAILPFLFAPVLAVWNDADFWRSLSSSRISIEWVHCGDAEGSSLQCALFDIPLDWNDLSAGHGQLALIRLPALGGSSLGTIFTNPGGPGKSGLEHVVVHGRHLADISGGLYHIVGFDPRGVGQIAIPPDSICFDSHDDFSNYWRDSFVKGAWDVPGVWDGRSPSATRAEVNNLLQDIDDFRAAVKGLQARCAEADSGRYMQYVGTTATVRDIVALADVLDGESAPINFWGFGYGTLIGNYLINMFPKRSGRVILDGVEDPVMYANTRSDLSWRRRIESLEQAFRAFVQDCRSSSCSLATFAPDGDVTSWIHNLLHLAFDAGKKGYDVDSVNVRDAIHAAMYDPDEWNALSDNLVCIYDAIASLDGSSPDVDYELTSLLPEADENDTEEGINLSLEAIMCGDSPDAGDVTSQMMLDEFVDVTHEVSGLFGPQFPQPVHFCSSWPFRAVERFQGPWNHVPARPILVLGNTVDPATPITNAENVVKQLGRENAKLVRQVGVGHTTFVHDSPCVKSLITDYLEHGTLPPWDDTTCSPLHRHPSLTPISDRLSPSSVSNSRIGGAAVSRVQETLHLKRAAANDTDTDANELQETQADLVQTRKERKAYFISTVVLAVCTGLLLIVVCIHMIQSRCAAPKDGTNVADDESDMFERDPRY
ncbi:hypothetical protein FISHEDRAFT_76953 [Fistulina hepatica ATCC 64428]|uniref:Peptidase S33 tripeptidyl aminopeptidase-like C-terminal domain-containing protein n=1 Tax=Fistulina hepatica ATCC 64428 TaxID=1128425 RepID=A0A0D7A5C7_9AGAR|nr:hypothetical protein FISHEDRAFT_76953 [Fistulina hepatica ATCC 64428]